MKNTTTNLKNLRKQNLPDQKTELFEKKSTRSIGNIGEDKAVSFLKAENYTIVSRNWRTRTGEIDIIAEEKKSDDENILVFAEVKTLPSGDLETLGHELNLRKQKRIIETAKFFLTKHRQYNNSKIRFDVLVIDMPDFPPVYHIKNAFSEFV